MPRSEALILDIIEDGIEKVYLNRPKKNNAISYEMYNQLTRILQKSSDNKEIYMLVITGVGKYYSSGNDMMSFLQREESKDGESSSSSAYKEFVDAVIRYPKLLVAIVNGPAIGIAVTTLALFDIIYASENATFVTPFSKLGLIGEACSTYTFPRIMGPSKAGDMLYMGRTMSANEAKECGLVSEVFEDHRIDQIWAYLKQVSSLSLQSIMATKSLVKKWSNRHLLDVNNAEYQQLLVRLQSDDCAKRMIHLLTHKNKL